MYFLRLNMCIYVCIYSIRFRKSRRFCPKGFNPEGSDPEGFNPDMSGAENSMHVISKSFFNFFQTKLRWEGGSPRESLPQGKPIIKKPLDFGPEEECY
jgi:hypothetical protein